MALTDNGIKVLDIMVKGGFVAVLAAVVAYYGQRLENDRARQAETHRRQQEILDVTSHQKEFDVEIGMRLFGTLISSFFQKDKSTLPSEAVRQQLLSLRLIALNFQEVPIDLKPLFEDLDSQLTTPEERKALRDIAQDIARRQAQRLTVNGGYDSGPKTVKAGDEWPIPNLLTTVKIESVSADCVHASIYSKAFGGRSFGPFRVTYFNTPLVDNTKLGDAYRVALILHESSAEKAEVRFVAFPKQLAGDRFDIKEATSFIQESPVTQ